MEKRIQKYKRIAVLGPESCGKTTLCKYLSEQYGYAYVREYARPYCSTLDRPYAMRDLVHIAEVQFERNLEESSEPLVCDTEMITMAIWAQDKYGEVPPEIFDLLSEQDFDIYLLCSPDIPWEKDPLRENPTDRARLFSIYELVLSSAELNYVVVRGLGDERYQELQLH